ncbi:hypothetical protein [Streptomyces sp. NPDC051636]
MTTYSSSEVVISCRPLRDVVDGLLGPVTDADEDAAGGQPALGV